MCIKIFGIIVNNNRIRFLSNSKGIFWYIKINYVGKKI